MNHLIKLEQAQSMVKTYRTSKDNILSSEYQGKDLLPICETFDRSAFDRLLSQPNCVSVRIYGGMNEQLQFRSIIVGVDKDGKDILPPASPESSTSTSEGEDEDDKVIIEQGNICPPLCPDESDLYP